MASDTGGAWWSGAVGYEIYVRSFADSSGDGIGDLRGVTDHLDHLADLGIDVLWLTPFYPTPGFDHGYDVSDYCAVDPAHGTLEDFENLTTAAHERGLKVVIDLVPNHTSADHPWFRDALANPDGPRRDYYVWEDPAPDGGPPNNWVSHFGGPAWTHDPVSGQYYCHLFLPEQPDLNWANPAVVAEFDRILMFWADQGVDGFRIDVAHGLVKDPLRRDNSLIRPLTPDMGPVEVFESFAHDHDLDQNANIEIFRGWNRLLEPRNLVLIGEIGVTDQERAARYVADGDGLHEMFFLESTYLPWDPPAWRNALTGLQPLAPTGVSWVLSCHDRPRAVTRFGGGARGAERAFALATFIMGLGGTPFIYQGEELGLPDGRVRPGHVSDPLAVRNPGSDEVGRDGCRTPMPWTGGPTNGFSPSGRSWLPSDDRPVELTVAAQSGDPASMLNRYRDLIAFRHRTPALWEEPLRWLDSETDVLLGRRPRVLMVLNMAPDRREIPLVGGPWALAFGSRCGSCCSPAPQSLVVEPETCLILTRE
ncbi:MAG TPA: hypothetical protein ENI86_07880 [Acidimicrobiales bacterium]|nr:hypothetical protein [Acidimicrobiales bacterium]